MSIATFINRFHAIRFLTKRTVDTFSPNTWLRIEKFWSNQMPIIHCLQLHTVPNLFIEYRPPSVCRLLHLSLATSKGCPAQAVVNCHRSQCPENVVQNCYESSEFRVIKMSANGVDEIFTGISPGQIRNSPGIKRWTTVVISQNNQWILVVLGKCAPITLLLATCTSFSHLPIMHMAH